MSRLSIFCSALLLFSGCATQPPAPAPLPGSHDPALIYALPKPTIGTYQSGLRSYDYRRFTFTSQDGRTTYKVVLGPIGGAKGITAPSESIAKTVPLKYKVTSVGGIDVIELESGWARVSVTGPAVAKCPPDPSAKPFFPTPWRIVITKSMATGAYGSEYTVAATPDVDEPDEYLQLAFAEAGCIVALPIKGTEADQKAITPGYRFRLENGGTFNNAKHIKRDTDDLLKQAKDVFDHAR